MMLRLAPVALVVVPAPALADTCESVRLNLPESVADAVRPYVACGMFRDEGAYKLTGISPTAVSPPLERGACATVRANAAVQAASALRATMPDPAERERYVESVLQDADRFLDAADTSVAIAIDPAERLAACDTDQTGTANATDR